MMIPCPRKKGSTRSSPASPFGSILGGAPALHAPIGARYATVLSERRKTASRRPLSLVPRSSVTTPTPAIVSQPGSASGGAVGEGAPLAGGGSFGRLVPAEVGVAS